MRAGSRQRIQVDETGPAFLGGLADIVAAAGRVLPLLASACRTCDGMPQAAYGPDGVSARAGLNRPAFVNSLAAGASSYVTGQTLLADGGWTCR